MEEPEHDSTGLHNEAKEHSEENGHAKDSASRPPFSLLHEILFVAIICSAQLLTQASFGQAIAPLHIIGDSFGTTNPGQLSWFAAAYSLTVGTFILIAGRLGDLHGHKRLFIAGYLWFGLWSLIAGLSVYSHSQIFFDVCRAFQGIGPALLLPNSLAILGRTYPPGKRKDMIFSLFGATAPNGFIFGAVFISLLAERAWWPWGYWIMAITCVIAASLAYFVIPSATQEPSSDKSFDYFGSILGVAGLVLFNVAWNQAPIVGWSTPYVYILLILGLLLLVAFFVLERKVSTPLVPFQAFSGKTGFVLGCIVLGWSSFGIWVFYFWQFSEVLRRFSPLLVSAQIVPAGISGLCAAVTTGILLSRLHPSYIMSMAMLAFCVGNILLATMPVGQTYWLQTFFSTIVTPWGMDMSFPAATIILSDFMPREHQGLAASLVNTLVNYSISIGLGIGGTVEVHVNRGNEDLLRGYRGAWYAGIGLSGMGLVLALYFILSEQIQRRRNVKQ